MVDLAIYLDLEVWLRHVEPRVGYHCMACASSPSFASRQRHLSTRHIKMLALDEADELLNRQLVAGRDSALFRVGLTDCTGKCT